MTSGASRIFSWAGGLVFFVFATTSMADGPRKKAPLVLKIQSTTAPRQAEALSDALVARLRVDPLVIQPVETRSFGILSAALKCTAADAACVEKVGNELGRDSVFWGELEGTPPNVHAELHLWVRGGPIATARGEIGDVVDAENEELRRTAGRILGQLLGPQLSAHVLLRAERARGDVSMDGAPFGKLERGDAEGYIRAGKHEVSVEAEGYEPAKQTFQAQPGEELHVQIPLRRTPSMFAEASARDSDISVKTWIGATLLAGAAGFALAGSFEAVHFQDLRSQNQDDHGRVESLDFCSSARTSRRASDACDTLEEARAVRQRTWIFYGLGGLCTVGGLYLLLSGKPAPKDARIVPNIHLGGAGITGHVRF